MYPNSYIFLTEELNLVWIFDMSYYWKLLDLSQDEKYSRVRNKHTPMFIDFWNFFQEPLSYYGLKRLCLFFLSNFTEVTSIPDSRVQDHNWNLNNQFVVQKNIWLSKTGLNISSQRQLFIALSQELLACTICEPKWINSCIQIRAGRHFKEKILLD